MKIKKPNILEAYLIILITAIVIGFYLIFYPLVEAQTPAVNPIHEKFEMCNDGSHPRISGFTYTDQSGQTVTQVVPVLIGCLKSGLRAFDLRALRTDADNIPTASLAKEHVDMCIQLLVRTQKEIFGALRQYEQLQRFLGESCLLGDIKCGNASHIQTAHALKNVTDYWVSPFAFELTNGVSLKPPTKEDYIKHFKLCAFGTNGNGNTGLTQWLGFRDWLEQTMLPWKINQVRSYLKSKSRSKVNYSFTNLWTNIRDYH